MSGRGYRGKKVALWCGKLRKGFAKLLQVFEGGDRDGGGLIVDIAPGLWVV